MAVSISQSIDELIPMIYSDIESKKHIVSSMRNQYFPMKDNTIIIKSFTFFDLIDEFDITISQSLQAIQTLQTEIWNLKEKIETAEEQKLRSTYNNPTQIIEKPLVYDYTQVKEYNDLLKRNNRDCNDHLPIQNEPNQYIDHHNSYKNIMKPSNSKQKLPTSKQLQLYPHNNNQQPQQQQQHIYQEENPEDLDEYEGQQPIQSPNPKQYFNQQIQQLQQEKLKRDMTPNISETEENMGEQQELKTSKTEKIDLPIKKSIRHMIKSIQKETKDLKEQIYESNNTINQTLSNQSKILPTESKGREGIIQKLLKKISMVEIYRIYLADKYGNGNYNKFLQKIKTNDYDARSLEEELKIIVDLMTQQINTESTCTNNNYFTNTQQSSIQNRLISTSLRKPCINKKPSQGRNAYIEPVKFSTYLRTDQQGSQLKGKSKHMSFSNDRRY